VLSLNSYKENNIFYDLSHEISPDTSTFPVWWHKKVEFEILGTLENAGRRTTHLHIGTHLGTHIDAPSHFIAGGESIDKLKIDHFIGSAIVVNFDHFDQFQEVQVSDLEQLDLSQISGEIVIFKFGWSNNFGKDIYYSNQPYFSISACEYLLSRNPKTIGYDLAMPDDPRNGQSSDCDSPAHKLFLGAGVPLLENLNLRLNIPKEINISCTPLKLKDLDGSPVRCVGWSNG